jgi:hypothetical protein
VPTSVGLAVGDWSRALSFGANEQQEITLPPLADRDAWVLRVTTGAKFSPRDLDSKNRDFRRLGVWIEFP